MTPYDFANRGGANVVAIKRALFQTQAKNRGGAVGSHNRVVDGYIEENEAIEVLAKLTGREITVQDMRKCASQGIVPAYAQFLSLIHI